MELKDLKNLANLARMEVTDAELEKVGKDFSSILDYVGQIKDATVDKDEAKPLIKNVSREDGEPVKDKKGRNLVSYAKENTQEYVKVPKVIE